MVRGVRRSMPLVDQNSLMIQVLSKEEEARSLVAKLVDDGLEISGITARVSHLHNSCSGGDVVTGRIENFCSSETGIQLMRAELAQIGHILAWRTNTFPNTPVPDGTADFVLDISETGLVPKSTYNLDHGTWVDQPRVVLQGRRKFCYYCRDTKHLRKNRPVAPECRRCHSRAHATLKCQGQAIPPVVPSPPAAILPAILVISATIEQVHVSPSASQPDSEMLATEVPAAASPTNVMPAASSPATALPLPTIEVAATSPTSPAIPSSAIPAKRHITRASIKTRSQKPYSRDFSSAPAVSASSEDVSWWERTGEEAESDRDAGAPSSQRPRLDNKVIISPQ